MIGQEQIIRQMEEMILHNEFPRFMILVGMKGSGKRTLAEYISHRLHATYFYQLPDVKVDTVRSMISDVYKIKGTVVYVIPDADSMSVSAKNALLKITEEPPNNAYFIMTLENADNTLNTIKSRASVFVMQSYSAIEILKYAEKYSLTKDQRQIVADIALVPGEVDVLVNMGIAEFYDFVALVVDNITETSMANSFKIADKIALKKDSEGYDLKLFWRAYIQICLGRIAENPIKNSQAIAITGRFLSKLNINGISKQMLFDDWILSIREGGA